MKDRAGQNLWISSGAVMFLFFMTPFLFAEITKVDAIPAEEYSGETTPPGIDAAVQASQQEVRDPFEDKFSAAAPIRNAQETMSGPPVQVLLQGIGMGAKGSYAVIDGEVFYAGEEKKGIKIIEVRRREVDIVVGGEPRTVLLFPKEALEGTQGRYPERKTVTSSPQELRGKGPGFSPGRERSASWQN
jgi:hypothetical protein